MLRASIDLGTNTCLLLIAETDQSSNGIRAVVEDHSRIVRLGQGVDQSRSLAPEAMGRAMECLRDYASKIRARGLDPSTTVCVATSQARDASNGAEFFRNIEKETGLIFRTLSGEDEARFTFLGALLPGMDPGRCAVIDIGGGSTEIRAEDNGPSLDIGAVRFTERYLKSDPVTDEEFWRCQDAIDAALLGMTDWRDRLPADLQLVAVAGTATTLGSMHLALNRFEASRLDGLVLTRGDIHRAVEELKWRTIAERREMVGMDPGRADVILAGALILWRAMELLRFPSLQVSTRGLRYGALLATR